MESLNSLETAVLEKMLDAESETFSILKQQYLALQVQERKMTGVGFFTRFFIPVEVPSLPNKQSFHISDVAAKLNDNGVDAGFVLFVKNGRIQMLEGYTYDEPWPQFINNFSLSYDGTSNRK